MKPVTRARYWLMHAVPLPGDFPGGYSREWVIGELASWRVSELASPGITRKCAPIHGHVAHSFK